MNDFFLCVNENSHIPLGNSIKSPEIVYYVDSEESDKI